MPVPCSARRTNGQPCANYAMHGGHVCHAHGGRAPRVRAAAERRVAEEQMRQVNARLAREIAREQAQQVARYRALQPWSEELGPHYVWQWHSPQSLRRIAQEMRRCAAELTAIAREDACTSS